jgi:hypothetical protein
LISVALDITATIQNTGQTPAKHLTAFSLPMNLPPTEDLEHLDVTVFRSLAEAMAKSKGTVAAGIAHHGAIAPNTIGDLTRAFEGHTTIIFFARIEYDDVFGKRHHTETLRKCAFRHDPRTVAKADVPTLLLWRMVESENMSD